MKRTPMLNRTVLTYILAFSLALNLATAATLGVLWWKGQARAADEPLAQKSMREFLTEDLGFNTDQSAKFLRMIDEKRQRVEQLRHLLESNRSEMLNLVGAPALDLVAVNAKVDEMNRTQGALRHETIRTIGNISAALSPGDRKKFRSLSANAGLSVRAHGTRVGQRPVRAVQGSSMILWRPESNNLPVHRRRGQGNRK